MVLEQIGHVDGIVPLPGEPGVQVLMHGDEMIRLSDQEVATLRAGVMTQLDKAAQRARRMNDATYDDGQEHLKLNYEEHPYVGFAVSLISGEEAVDLWERVLAPIREANGLLTTDYQRVHDRNDVPLAKKAEIVLAAVEKAELARVMFNEGQDRALSAAGDIVTGLTITRDLAFAVSLSIGAVLAAPVVAAGATGLGLSGGAGFVATGTGTGLVVGTGGAALRGGSAMLGTAAAGGSSEEVWAAGKAEGWRGAKEGFAIGVGAGTALSAGRALGVGAQHVGRLEKIRRTALASGAGNAAGQMTSTALEGKGAGDVALSGVKGFGFGALGGGAGALTSGVRNPVLRFAAQTGTESLLAGGTTYLAGGSRNEIITSAAIGGVSSAATNVARHPIGESAAERRAFEIGHGIRNRTRSFTTAAMIGLDEPALTLRGSGTAPSTEILRRPSVLSGPSVLGGPEPAAHMPVTAPPPKSSPVPASAPSQGAPELPAPVRLPTMQPSAPSGVRARETLDEFLTRGGKIQKLPSESTPEPTITAAPKWKPDTRTVFGEGPEVDAIREASSSRAGIKVVR